MGPRPAGSAESRRLARLLKRIVPRGRYQEVPDGLRNVIGTVRGREPGYIVVGAHYDTKDIPGFVGANDGASGTAVVAQLARTLRRPRHTIQFVFFDGEEAPRGIPDFEFERYGLRGSKVAAPTFRDARAMILLDFVGDKKLTIRREGYSDVRPLEAHARGGAACGRGRRVPRHDAGRRARRPHPVPEAGRALDRPDRLRLPRAGTAAATTCPPSPSAAWTRSGKRCTSSCRDSEARSLASPAMPAAPEKLLLAAPRGYCAGVDRAVQTVERALELYGPPVYVRKEIVHNKHVVEQLRERGAVFVEEETEVPEGETVVFSAHGVSPAVHANAETRRLTTIDATCPLVTKVHVEAKKFAAEGYTIVLIGHEGHEEVEGTMGEAPDHFVLVETEEDVDNLELEDPDRVAYLTQTTLSVDETDRIIRRLRERFPNITGPKSDDICYATTNRQLAVRQMARECDLVLVIGSQQLLELEPARRGRPRPRRRVAPDRQRDPGEGGVARGQARGRHLVRRERSRGARSAPGGLLPRARHHRRLGVRGRPGGRALHAPQGHQDGAGGTGVNCTPCRRSPGTPPRRFRPPRRAPARSSPPDSAA